MKGKKSQTTAGGIEESGTAGSCLFSKRGGEGLRTSKRREGKQGCLVEIQSTQRYWWIKSLNGSLSSPNLVGRFKKAQFSNWSFLNHPGLRSCGRAWATVYHQSTSTQAESIEARQIERESKPKMLSSRAYWNPSIYGGNDKTSEPQVCHQSREGKNMQMKR